MRVLPVVALGLAFALLILPARIAGQAAPDLVRVSVGPAGVQANGPSAAPVVSANGRYVAFDSDASNLVPNDTNGTRDVFLADLEARTVERISVSSVGGEGNGPSYSPAMSADGARIVYVSEASTLVSGDTNLALDVFLYDRVSRQTTRVHAHSGPPKPSALDFYRRFLQWQVDISRDGQLVAYIDDRILYLYDLALGQVETASEPSDLTGQPPRMPRISPGGDAVYFDRGPLGPGEGLGRRIMYYSRVARVFWPWSVGPYNPAPDDDVTHAECCGSNGTISATRAGFPFATLWNSPSEPPEPPFLRRSDPTGRYEATAVGTIVSGGGRYAQIAFRDTQLGTRQRVSASPSGEWGNGPSTLPTISADGAVVAFSSGASDLVADDTNGVADVFARRIGPCVTGIVPAGPFEVSGTGGNIDVTIVVSPGCTEPQGGPRTIVVSPNATGAPPVSRVFRFGEQSVVVNQGAGPDCPPVAQLGDLQVSAAGGTFYFALTPFEFNHCFSTIAVSDRTWLAYDTHPQADTSLREHYVTVARNTSFAPRTGFVYLRSAPWLTVVQALPQQHFAEGATGGFFDTRIALFQGAGSDLPVRLTFTKNTGEQITRDLTLPAARPVTVFPRTIPGLESAEFSTTVSSEAPLAADRTMTWDASGYGAHAETAQPAPAPRWYLAEGTTQPGFSLFYLLQNPDATTASQVRISYLLPEGPPVVRDYVLPPHSRTTVWVNQLPEVAGRDVSASFEVVAGPPIVVERTQYYSSGPALFAAGHGAAAVTEPRASWLFAEGATGPFFDTFLLLANPTPIAADVEVSYYLPTGGPLRKRYTVPAQSRYTIWVDEERIPSAETALANTGVAMRVQAFNVPIVAERAMWWPGSAATWSESHASAGATTPGVIWMSAEGEAGGSRQTETYLLVSNPFRQDAWPGQPTPTETPFVYVRVFAEDGTHAMRSYPVGWESRVTVPIRQDFPEVDGKRFAMTLHSGFDGRNAFSIPMIVERSMYWNANGEHWAAGTNAVTTRVE